MHGWNATPWHQNSITGLNAWIVIIFVKEICLQIKFGEIFWGAWGENWCIKRGGGYKQKGNDYTFLLPSNS